MKAKRWTLGVVLAAAVSLVGLIQADASPFSTYILSDDLGNQVNGTAPEQSNWDATSDSSDGTDGGGSTSGDGNNGHGNNLDGVDSSNKGKGNGGPNGAVDESCDGTGECIDDEIKGSESDSTSSSSKGNGKKK